MKHTHKPNIYKLNIYVAISIFAVISFLWLYIFNRYHIIGFQEEIQLFRTDYLYFKSYLNTPGGIIDYLSSFFIQFYYYKWLGAAIITLCISLVFILFVKICKSSKNTIERFIILPFIIPILLLMVCCDMYLHLTYILSICFILVCIIVYINIPKSKNRYIGGLLLYLMAYFVTGGNAILYALLVIINELFKKERSLLYIAFLMATAAIIPYIAHLLIYIAPLKSTYLAFTPFAFKFTNKAYTIAWLAIPIIYLISGYINNKSWLEKANPIKVLIPTYILILLMLLYGTKSVYEPDVEYIAEIEYKSEQGKWNEVLDISSKYQYENGRTLCAYYTNIALSELGLLSSKMFHYNQIGTAGLFVSWTPIYLTPWHSGELYYRLGIIQEAEHCAYETMVNGIREHASKPLRRLVYTSMLRKDSAGFEKYIKLFESSPIYNTWAKQQREYYIKNQIDSTFQVPGTPKAIKHNDFFINYDTPEYNLIVPLRTNGSDKKAFEYLMASLLLQKDLKTMISVIEKYYASISYDKMPRHYEEALLISASIFNDQSDILSRYPICKETINNFREYIQLSEQATYKEGIDNLRRVYGHTYWFYFQHVNPIPLEQSKINNRY
ncbi:MAG: DUF6057 family protein [Dysgonomonas sp.]